MAGSKSDALEVDVLKAVTGQTTAVLPTAQLPNVFCGLFTATPSDAGGGTEVSTAGTAYARVETVGKWAAPTSGSPSSVTTNAVVTFPTATASWGTVTQFGLFTASTAGTLLMWGDLTAGKLVGSGDTASFASGALTLTED